MLTQTSRQRRDTGLENLSTITRWVVAAAFGLTGVLAVVAAHALPGHTKHTTTPAGGAGAGAQSAGAASGSSSGSNTLQPPSQPPTISTSPPQVVSGGS